jgi:hypothetical protein
MSTVGRQPNTASHYAIGTMPVEFAAALGNRKKFKGKTPPERAYFNCVEIDENVVLSLVPMPLTVGMIASAMPAATRAYSMAVAADSSLRNALTIRGIAAGLAWGL